MDLAAWFPLSKWSYAKAAVIGWLLADIVNDVQHYLKSEKTLPVEAEAYLIEQSTDAT